MSDPEPPWHKRQEIPDRQIRDAADQYEAARKLLLDQPRGSGVLLPLINNATIAIELYLKSLSAQLVHTPVSNFPRLTLVTTKPSLKGHRLVALLDELPNGLIRGIEDAFARERNAVSVTTFRQALEECEGAFADSRYPFEPGVDISAYPLSILMFCSCFLAKFVSELPSSERIEWKQ
jgi:hypothetical protein